MTKIKLATGSALLALASDASAHGGIAGAMEAVKYLFMMFLVVAGTVLIFIGFIAIRRERWSTVANRTQGFRIVFITLSILFLVPAFGISRDGAAVFGLFFARDLLHTILVVISLALTSMAVVWLGISRKTKLSLFAALLLLVIIDAVTTPEILTWRTYSFIESAPLDNPVVISEVFDEQLVLLDNGLLVYSDEKIRVLDRAQGNTFSAIIDRQAEQASGVRLMGLRESSQYRTAVARSQKVALVSLNLVQEDISRYEQYTVGDFRVLDRSWSIESLPINLSIDAQIECCHPEWVAKALAMGMDPNESTHYFGGTAPLLSIAHLRPSYREKEGIRRIAELLIARGASLETSDAQGASPLHHAAKSDNGLLVALLLEAGAELDHVDSRGATALHYAAENEKGHGQAIAVLLKSGSDVAARNSAGDTPLHYAAAYGGYGPTLALLKAGADLDASNHEGLTPLHRAVGQTRSDVAEALLEWGANPNLKDKKGNSPLHYAIDRPATLEALLAGGADPGLRNGDGHTALDLATAQFWSERDRWPYRKIFELLRNGVAANGSVVSPSEQE